MKGFLVAFEAAIAAALAFLAVYRLVTPIPAGQKAVTVKLVLASRDLELGTIIRDADLMLTDWPGEVRVPAGASSHTQDFVDRGVITKIYAHEPILEGRLAPKGAGGGFAVIIPQGMRAVAVAVNQVVGVAGFVVPGMHVDVFISGTPPSGTGGRGTLTRTLRAGVFNRVGFGRSLPSMNSAGAGHRSCAYGVANVPNAEGVVQRKWPST